MGNFWDDGGAPPDGDYSFERPAGFPQGGPEGWAPPLQSGSGSGSGGGSSSPSPSCYATMDDIIALYGADNLDTWADPQNNGRADPALVAKALTEASSICDSYLAMRYVLPLISVPVFLQSACIDIAIYRMVVTGDRCTEEMKERYKEAISHLKDVASGKAGLGFAGTLIQQETPDTKATRSGIVGFTLRR
jgi:phage gp36-like protein